MTFLDKLRIIKKMWDEDKSLDEIISFADTGMDEEFINRLRERYPFLPDVLFDCYRITDGFEIFSIVFYGSGATIFGDFDWLIQYSSYAFDIKGYPFAKEPSGEVYWIDEKGNVHFFTDLPYEDNILANSFEDFMNETMFGPLFGSQYVLGTESEDPWLQLLTRLGWHSGRTWQDVKRR